MIKERTAVFAGTERSGNMRTITTIHEAMFAKSGEAETRVALPHTWNAFDGQDGGGDYWRGAGFYRIALPAPSKGMRQYIRFLGAGMTAAVSCNGRLLGVHRGGFSAFSFDLTAAMKEDGNELEVTVSNAEDSIYPQQADFTFFGGLYRDVDFIEVPPAHFSFEKSGSTGVFLTPRASGLVRADAFTEGAEGCTVNCSLKDADGREVLKLTAPAQAHTVLKGTVESPHLWNGIPDPYCYTAEVTVEKDGAVLDTAAEQIGFRSYHVDPANGFFLNGRSYPLHGVARHQDRLGKGWAVSREDHGEDLALILEIGANTIRLAHYQHDPYFYSLCDRAGLVLWAEIPFISVFMAGREAHDNTLSQMTELIAQNYNHPSICFWGISNEITIGGESEALYQNLCELNALAKKLDPSRLTTMAQVSMVPLDSEHVYLTDVQSYNHYFGWYAGDAADNGPWLDEFHRRNPDRALGVSEYGAEGIVTLHSEKPQNHDYTEEYQAQYHHAMLETFASRPYLWATHVWNMFDFGADNRDEGGCRGRNNKGLVTYDRKIRKDSFFLYKAYWTKAPMVHVCGQRFRDRAPGQRDVTVFTNCPEVTLTVNGAVFGTAAASAHAALFRGIPLNAGDNTVTASAAGASDDTILLCGVPEPNSSYRLPEEKEAAGNWFDAAEGEGTLEFREGYFSIRDKLGDILENREAAAAAGALMSKMAGGASANMAGMLGMLKHMTLETILKMAGKRVPKGTDVYANNILNRIKK